MFAKLAAVLGDLAILHEDLISKFPFSINASYTCVATIIVKSIHIRYGCEIWSDDHPMHLADVTIFWVTGVTAAYARAVRDHQAHFLAYHVGRVYQVNRVAVALGHLAPVGAGQDRNVGVHSGRFRKDFAIKMIKTADDFAGHLNVRRLIFADRNGIGF